MVLLLCVLMLSPLSGCLAKVVTDFKSRNFFANGESPTLFSGTQYKQINQTLNGVVYYVTYYDTYNKIPVYSAYRFEGKMDCTRKNNWYIEPQLDDMTAGPNMASEGSVYSNLRGVHQALDEDYENSGYNRGHLAPVYLARSQSCADATFTFTNAAPQNPSFNSGQWRVLEKYIASNLSYLCLPSYTVYIVTGVVPGTEKLKESSVNVPSHFWTAYCCLDNNNKCQISRGFIGENKNITPQNITVNDLELKLKILYKVTSLKVFNNSPNAPN